MHFKQKLYLPYLCIVDPSTRDRFTGDSPVKSLNPARLKFYGNGTFGSLLHVLRKSAGAPAIRGYPVEVERLQTVILQAKSVHCFIFASLVEKKILSNRHHFPPVCRKHWEQKGAIQRKLWKHRFHDVKCCVLGFLITFEFYRSIDWWKQSSWLTVTCWCVQQRKFIPVTIFSLKLFGRAQDAFSVICTNKQNNDFCIRLLLQPFQSWKVLLFCGWMRYLKHKGHCGYLFYDQYPSFVLERRTRWEALNGGPMSLHVFLRECETSLTFEMELINWQNLNASRYLLTDGDTNVVVTSLLSKLFLARFAVLSFWINQTYIRPVERLCHSNHS